MLDLIPGSDRSMDDGRDARYSQGSALRMLIEGAVMTEVHLQESHRDASGSTLRSNLRDVCAEAKRLDLRAEQLLTVIKSVWYSIPAAQAHERPADARTLLSRVVTMVIDEYYRGPRE